MKRVAMTLFACLLAQNAFGLTDWKTMQCGGKYAGKAPGTLEVGITYGSLPLSEQGVFPAFMAKALDAAKFTEMLDDRYCEGTPGYTVRRTKAQRAAAFAAAAPLAPESVMGDLNTARYFLTRWLTVYLSRPVHISIHPDAETLVQRVKVRDPNYPVDFALLHTYDYDTTSQGLSWMYTVAVDKREPADNMVPMLAIQANVARALLGSAFNQDFEVSSLLKVKRLDRDQMSSLMNALKCGGFSLASNPPGMARPAFRALYLKYLIEKVAGGSMEKIPLLFKKGFFREVRRGNAESSEQIDDVHEGLVESTLADRYLAEWYLRNKPNRSKSIVYVTVDDFLAMPTMGFYGRVGGMAFPPTPTLVRQSNSLFESLEFFLTGPFNFSRFHVPPDERPALWMSKSEAEFSRTAPTLSNFLGTGEACEYDLKIKKGGVGSGTAQVAVTDEIGTRQVPCDLTTGCTLKVRPGFKNLGKKLPADMVRVTVAPNADSKFTMATERGVPIACDLSTCDAPSDPTQFGANREITLYLAAEAPPTPTPSPTPTSTTPPPPPACVEPSPLGTPWVSGSCAIGNSLGWNAYGYANVTVWRRVNADEPTVVTSGGEWGNFVDVDVKAGNRYVYWLTATSPCTGAGVTGPESQATILFPPPNPVSLSSSYPEGAMCQDRKISWYASPQLIDGYLTSYRVADLNANYSTTVIDTGYGEQSTLMWGTGPGRYLIHTVQHCGESSGVEVEVPEALPPTVPTLVSQSLGGISQETLKFQWTASPEASTYAYKLNAVFENGETQELTSGQTKNTTLRFPENDGFYPVLPFAARYELTVTPLNCTTFGVQAPPSVTFTVNQQTLPYPTVYVPIPLGSRRATVYWSHSLSTRYPNLTFRVTRMGPDGTVVLFTNKTEMIFDDEVPMAGAYSYDIRAEFPGGAVSAEVRTSITFN